MAEWTVRNHDLEPLGRVFYTMEIIKSLKRKRDFHEEMKYNIAQRITGMPRGNGFQNTLDEILIDLEEIDSQYADEVRKYTQELKRVDRILNGIKDIRMRIFVEMFYVDGIKAKHIKDDLAMSERRFQEIQMAIETAEDMKSVIWPE